MGQPEVGTTSGAEARAFAPNPSPPPTPRAGDAHTSAPTSVRHLSGAFSEAENTRRLQTLAFELTVAEARERQRIAHVLHDEVGQLLAMAQFKLSELSQAVATSASPEAGRFDEVRGLLRQAAQATRSATFELHSPVLQQLGLEAAVQSLAQRAQRASAMRIHVASELPDFPFDAAVLSVLFRIVRELVLNAQKHAQAANLSISLGFNDDGLKIRVADDGVGFDAASATRHFTPEGGFGLISAEAQMQGLGGRLVVDSARGRGTTVTLFLVLSNAARCGASA